MKLIMKSMILACFIPSLLLSSCHGDSSDDCDFRIIPIPVEMYVVTGAGPADCNGEYHPYIDTWNGKVTYNITDSPANYHILYDTTYGWSINQGAFGSSILYYSDMHGDEPPGEGSTAWYVLNGTGPAPAVMSDIYYFPQLIGNCL